MKVVPQGTRINKIRRRNSSQCEMGENRLTRLCVIEIKEREFQYLFKRFFFKFHGLINIQSTLYTLMPNSLQTLLQLVKYIAKNCGGLPWWLSGKESASNAGDVGLIPGQGRSPGDGNDNPLQYSCLGNPMDREAWKGYSPWGHKELDRTQQLSTHAYTSIQTIANESLI